MSGHSKWAQIKHQKGTADAKKSKSFGKISQLIALAARKGKDPTMNPSLRDAISKAKELNMPADNIQRAIKRGSGELKDGLILEEFLYEAFGPGGCAILIEGITDNKNRILGEIKHSLSKHGAKLGEAGSCLWAFEKTISEWQPKHLIEVPEENKGAIRELIEELENQDDVQKVNTNCA